MDNKAHDLRREHWRKIIFECNNREAGTTKRDWCRLNGICMKSFYYRQRQFRSEAVSSSEAVAALHDAQTPQFLDITDRITDCRQKNIPYDDRPYDDRLGHPQTPELMISVYVCQIYVNGTVREQTLKTVMNVLRNA